jgi:ABC-type oligopeptide transport system substrate-binding subunit
MAPIAWACVQFDDYTLGDPLSHAVPYFPDVLTNTVASPVHPSSLAVAGAFRKPDKTVSNGPYVLAAFAPGASLLLKRNRSLLGLGGGRL